jgi:ketosteroid isomerase-like protein
LDDAERNKTTVRRWYAELGRANLEALEDMLSPDVVVHLPGKTGIERQLRPR